MRLENFVRIVRTGFEKSKKYRKMTVFWQFLAMFLTFQPYEFDEITQIGL